MPVSRKGAIGALTASVITASAAFLMPWEGYAPVAKHERIDPPGVITWCYGRTNYDDPTVKAGTRFTKEECKKQLEETIPKYAAPIAKCIPSFFEQPQERQVALISFSYNLGPGRICFCKKRDGKKCKSIADYANEGDWRGACNRFLDFTGANGKFIQGLLNRRRAERALCLKGL